jgi:protein TonB
MQFLIGIDGKVKKAKLIKSSGSPDLDDAAMSALQLCRFTPGKLDGQPAEAWTIVQYVWTLEDPPPAAAKADTQRE